MPTTEQDIEKCVGNLKRFTFTWCEAMNNNIGKRYDWMERVLYQKARRFI